MLILFCFCFLLCFDDRIFISQSHQSLWISLLLGQWFSTKHLTFSETGYISIIPVWLDWIDATCLGKTGWTLRGVLFNLLGSDSRRTHGLGSTVSDRPTFLINVSLSLRLRLISWDFFSCRDQVVHRDFERSIHSSWDPNRLWKYSTTYPHIVLSHLTNTDIWNLSRKLWIEKPLNPILGELFLGNWTGGNGRKDLGEIRLWAEQVSQLSLHLTFLVASLFWMNGSWQWFGSVQIS